MAYVVIGAGIAGVCCAQTLLKQQKKEVEVILITPGTVVKSASSLKQVSQVLTEFNVEEKDVDDFSIEFPGITIIKDQVLKIMNEKKCIITQSGLEIPYVKLSVCCGARPNVIFQNSDYVLGIRDTETAETFAKKLKYAERVLVVGNGGIAMEIVFKIQNCNIVWAIKDDSIGTTFLDTDASEFLLAEYFKNNESTEASELDFRRFKYTVHDLGSNSKHKFKSSIGSALGPDWHENLKLQGDCDEDKTIKFECKCDVKSLFILKEDEESNNKISDHSLKFNGKQWPVYVTLSNGKQYGCDLVVSATGVVPNTEVFSTVKHCEYGKEGGVKIDDQFRVLGCNGNVYAAGDVCCASWDHSPQWLQMRLWTQARQMGISCALNMLDNHEGKAAPGLDIAYELFAHMTKFFGYKIVLLGKFKGQGLDMSEVIVHERMRPGDQYVKVLMQNGRIQGAILIGETDLEETFENLILNGTDLSMFGENIFLTDIDLAEFFD